MLLSLLTLTLLYTQAYASVHTRSSSLDSAPIIDLGYAIYEGTFNQTSNATGFLGIRFAAPPVGLLRITHIIYSHVLILSMQASFASRHPLSP